MSMNIKNTLKKGDIVLTFNKNNKLSDLISGVTNSKWSHTTLHLGNGFLLESVTGGTKIVPVEKYLNPEHYDIGIFRSKKEIEIVDEALKLVGKRYGYIQLLWYLFVRLIGKSEDINWQLDIQPNALVCSEAIALVFEKKGYQIKPGLKSYAIEPVDFAESDLFERVL